ncbi:hypothetical protein Hanom_Chr09g00846121 [Helianthus anomalus]
MPIVSINRRHNLRTLRINRTITTTPTPPPQSNHLNIQRYRRTIPNHLGRDPREQKPAPHARNISIIKKHTSNITRITAHVSITALCATAVNNLEMGT